MYTSIFTVEILPVQVIFTSYFYYYYYYYPDSVIVPASYLVLLVLQFQAAQITKAS